MAPHYISWCGAVCMVRCCFWKKALTPCGPESTKARTWTAVCLRHAYTFSLVCIAWVFFRAASVSDALLLLSRLPVDWSLSTLHTTLLSIGIQPVAELVLGGALPASAARRRPQHRPRAAYWPFCLLALTVVAAWFSTLHTGTTNAFIYFNSDPAMKKLFTSMLCVFIAIPLLLTVWGLCPCPRSTAIRLWGTARQACPADRRKR